VPLIVKGDLVPAQANIAAEIREAIETDREENCRVVCIYCAANQPIERNPYDPDYPYHLATVAGPIIYRERKYIGCNAAAIRARG
jgi:hypothetical protein